MDQNEQPNESAAELGGEPSGDGAAKKKRRRRRGKKRGAPGDGTSQASESAQGGNTDADGDDGDDGDDGNDSTDDERNNSGVATERSSDAGASDGEPGRKKKRRRKKKKSSGEPSQETAPDSQPAQEARPQEGRQQDGRQQDGRRPAPRQPREARPPDGRPQEGRPQDGRPQDGRPQDGRPQEGRPQEGRPQRGQKQRPEPGSRGSVLQRRLDRIERDEPRSQPDAIEVTAPPPSNVANVDSYLSHLRGWQREVVTTLRALIRSVAPDIEESIKWSQPVYEYNGPVCYVKAFSDHVNFGFWRGTELDDPGNLLVGDLLKMRHVRIGHVNELQRDTFEQFVRQAVRLNKDKGDPTQ